MNEDYALDDRYSRREGTLFLSGVQALVRLPLIQRERDAAAGLNTAGYISGYRGSPLATYDMQLWRAKDWLKQRSIIFQPGLNEDLALTAVWGTQQAEARGEGRHDGVFAMWYGKGAGVDRSGDAFRHGSNAGSSRHGGVLVLTGDDHRAESSSSVHASEFSMMDYNIPVLNPANVREILEFGLHGFAMSRFTGSWVSLKCNHEVVESTSCVDTAIEKRLPVLPDIVLPPGGLNLRVPDTPLDQERRTLEFRLPAVQAYAYANGLDRTVLKPANARLGIVSTGKTALEVLEALNALGIDMPSAERLGIAFYKVGMPWPLEPRGMLEFCSGLDSILCVEEKRALIEPQLKNLLFGKGSVRSVVGKLDEAGRALFPASGSLTVQGIALAIAARLPEGMKDARIQTAVKALESDRRRAAISPVAVRKPYFCAGCPHNRSTVIPEGSLGGAGTGCNYMAMWMDRRSNRYTQMGADGANWIGEAPFSKRHHMFQNMGDGTYSHSGILAIRAAVAAGANITFKILYNDAVAMTGGQPHDAPVSVVGIVRQVEAEGVSRVAVVADDPDRHAGLRGVMVRGRGELDAVQRELREVPGVTVLIYDQMCATERRRRRKRGIMPDPARRAFINHLVCEGCGDCGVKSNCVAIAPLETDLGRKRQIDQHACNKDLSCTEGFCPSFVLVNGGSLRKPQQAPRVAAEQLPEPRLRKLDNPWNIVLSGVGGTGIVTISAILGTAAHIDGRGVAVLDMMGLAQKGGAVTSFVRLFAGPEVERTARVADGAADVVLGCDIMSVAGPEPLGTIGPGRTHVIVNTHEVLTGEFTRHPDEQFPAEALRKAINSALGKSALYRDFTAHAVEVTGDPIATNMLMTGFAFQLGLIPVSARSVTRAIELNGVSVAENCAAFEAGRRLALEREQPVAPRKPVDLDQLIAGRMSLLTQYQDRAYAERYGAVVNRVREAERRALPGSDTLARAVAHNLAKLMAYKDEYEVARLYSTPDFRAALDRQFDGDYRVKVLLAPPLLARSDIPGGEPRKLAFGPWIFTVFRLLTRLKRLRGTALDIFGYTAERRMERQLIADYIADVERLCVGLTPQNHTDAVAIASIPEAIRGFGHVKNASVEKARGARLGLLARFRGEPVRQAAE